MYEQKTSSGFSDLLYEFKDRTRTPTDIEEIRLKFRTSFDYYLYAVEAGTEFSMMLAVYYPVTNRWEYFLTSGTPARKLIEYFCQKHGFSEAPGILDSEFSKFKNHGQT